MYSSHPIKLLTIEQKGDPGLCSWPDQRRLVSQAEQADDNLIMPTSFPAFQAKVHNFDKWGANKRAFVSAKKSKWMIFGPLPAETPTLWCGNTVVKLVFEFKYVGVWFTSIHKNILARHCEIKASRARNVSSAIFALKHRIGSLPVREGLVLYMARADCYLVSGCELALDTSADLLAELQDAQHSFLRRLLGLNPCSMLALLFTETGQMPVRIRRLLLALGRLKYMRKAPTGLLLGDHNLSVERLRYGARYRRPVPHIMRLLSGCGRG